MTSSVFIPTLTDLPWLRTGASRTLLATIGQTPTLYSSNLPTQNSLSSQWTGTPSFQSIASTSSASESALVYSGTISVLATTSEVAASPDTDNRVTTQVTGVSTDRMSEAITTYTRGYGNADGHISPLTSASSIGTPSIVPSLQAGSRSVNGNHFSVIIGVSIGVCIVIIGSAIGGYIMLKRRKIRIQGDRFAKSAEWISSHSNLINSDNGTCHESKMTTKIQSTTVMLSRDKKDDETKYNRLSTMPVAKVKLGDDNTIFEGFSHGSGGDISTSVSRTAHDQQGIEASMHDMGQMAKRSQTGWNEPDSSFNPGLENPFQDQSWATILKDQGDKNEKVSDAVNNRYRKGSSAGFI